MDYVKYPLVQDVKSSFGLTLPQTTEKSRPASRKSPKHRIATTLAQLVDAVLGNLPFRDSPKVKLFANAIINV